MQENRGLPQSDMKNPPQLEYLQKLKHLLNSEKLEDQINALFQLRRYEEVQQKLSDNPSISEKFATELKEKLAARQAEKESGLYNQDSMMQEAKRKFYVDVNDFVSPKIELFNSPTKGRGYRALDFIRAGELLVASKAYIVGFVQFGEIIQDTFGMLRELKPKAENEFFNSLQKGQTRQLHFPDDTLRIRGNCFMFCYPMDGTMEEFENFAVCLQASLINHSCVPNTFSYSIGDVFFFKAGRNIEAGTEITTQYDNYNSFGQMRYNMLGKYFFECQCGYCTRLKSSQYEQIDQWIEKMEAGKVSVDEMISYAKSIKSIYDSVNIASDRMDLGAIYGSIGSIYVQKQPDKAQYYIVQSLTEDGISVADLYEGECVLTNKGNIGAGVVEKLYILLLSLVFQKSNKAKQVRIGLKLFIKKFFGSWMKLENSFYASLEQQLLHLSRQVNFSLD